MAHQLLLTFCLVAACAAKYTDINKAENVQNVFKRYYTTADCSDASIENDFKEFNVCWPKSVDDLSQGYRKAVVNGSTQWVETFYSDAACTTEDTSQSDNVLKLDTCVQDSDDASKYFIASVNASLGTLYYEGYSASGCTTASFEGGSYHGGDICSKDGTGESVLREIVGQDGNIILSQWNSSETCSGEPSKSGTVVADGTCVQHPNDATRWIKIWVWNVNGLSAPTPAPTPTPAPVPSAGGDASTTGTPGMASVAITISALHPCLLTLASLAAMFSAL